MGSPYALALNWKRVLLSTFLLINLGGLCVGVPVEEVEVAPSVPSVPPVLSASPTAPQVESAAPPPSVAPAVPAPPPSVAPAVPAPQPPQPTANQGSGTISTHKNPDGSTVTITRFNGPLPPSALPTHPFGGVGGGAFNPFFFPWGAYPPQRQ